MNIMLEQLEIWGVSDPNISAQLALAAQLDLFKQEAGLDVACKFIESGTTMPRDVVNADKPPFAFTQTPISALILHEQGFMTKIVAPLADIAGTQQVIIHEASGIRNPADLEGRRIGMAQGAAVYLAVKNMTNDCRIELDRLQFEHLLPHEQLQAFEDRSIDAIACWEPWTTKAQTMGGRFYFSGTRSEIPGLEGEINWLVNQSCLIVPEEHLVRQPELVVSILQVLRKATDLINQHRKDISKDLASFFGLSRLELIMAMQKNSYAMQLDNLFRIGVLEFRDFLYESGRISSIMPETLLYDSTLLKQVDPALVPLDEIATQNITILEQAGIYYRDDVSLPESDTPLKFLLADDSRFMRVTLARIIKQIGGDIIGEATNGSEAIEMFERLHPNVVTMDLSMPGVSGIDAVKAILEHDPSVSIVVISGANLKEVREQVFHLGVKMFITKPFDAQAVADILTKSRVA